MSSVNEVAELEGELRRVRKESEAFREQVFQAILRAEAKNQEWTASSIADEIGAGRGKVGFALLHLEAKHRLVEGTQRIVRRGLVTAPVSAPAPVEG